MSVGRAALAAFLALLLVAGGAGAGDPAPAAVPLASVEGIVRFTGVPAPARVEVRRIPTNPLAVLPKAELAWEDEDADPTLTGVVEAVPLATARGDEGGAYRVEGLPPGRYELRAIAEGGARAFASLVVAGAGARVKDLAVMPGTQSVRGRVRWVDGKPYRGSVVASQPREGRRATPWLDGAVPVETDEQGRFEVGGLLPGRVDLAAVVPGRLRETWTTQAGSGADGLDLWIGRDVAEAQGRVATTTGDAVPYAPLVCRSNLEDGTEILAVGRTDAEGRFRVLAASGSRRVHVRAPGFLSEGVVDSGGPFVVRLPRAPVLRGKVRRKSDGMPVQGAIVQLAVEAAGPWRTTTARSDAEGRYTIASATVGEASVVVQGGGWVAVDPATERRRLDPDGVYPVDFEAVAAARLSGRVLSEGGAPIEGALVDAQTTGDQQDRWKLDRVLDRRVEVGTDRDGRFVLEGLVPDVPVSLVVRHPRFGETRVRASPGADVIPEIRLAPQRVIVGHVVLPPGARPSDVWLRATPVPRARGDGAVPTPTPTPASPPLSLLPLGLDGSFRISPDEPGRYELWAGVWGAGTPYEGVAVVGEAGGETVLRLTRVEWSPRGWLFRILDPEGRPIPEGEITLNVVGPGYTGMLGRTFGEGEFSYWSPRTDTEIEATVTGFRDAAGRPLPYAVARTQDLRSGLHEIRLKPGRVVRGRLHTPDGSPVAHAEVSAIPARVAPEDSLADAWAETGIDGRFTLENLERRDYAIHLTRVEGMSPVAPVRARLGLDEVDLTILPLVRARIEVRTHDEGPMEGARVVVWGATGQGELATGALDARTGPDGSVTLAPLPPLERFELRIEPAGDDALAIERVGWWPAATVVTLPLADVLRGVVRDAVGAPVPDATVWVRGVLGGEGGPSVERAWWHIRDGYSLGSLCGADGTFAIGRLAPGEVEVFAAVAAADGTSRESPSTRMATGSREVVLTIPPR